MELTWKEQKFGSLFHWFAFCLIRLLPQVEKTEQCCVYNRKSRFGNNKIVWLCSSWWLLWNQTWAAGGLVPSSPRVSLSLVFNISKYQTCLLCLKRHLTRRLSFYLKKKQKKSLTLEEIKTCLPFVSYLRIEMCFTSIDKKKIFFDINQ